MLRTLSNKLFNENRSQIIGIDISSDSVKLLALDKKDNQEYQVEAFASVPLDDGAVVEKEIKNPEIVTKAIQKAIRD